MQPRRWCPSCSKKISADRGPRFIFSSNNPSSNPSNFDGHQASLQKIIRPTELLFLLPFIRLSLHPTVLQKRPRYVQCSRKSASTCLPLPPTVNTYELSKGISAKPNTRNAENILTALPVQSIAMAPVNSRRNQSSFPAGMFCLVIALQASHPRHQTAKTATILQATEKTTPKALCSASKTLCLVSLSRPSKKQRSATSNPSTHCSASPSTKPPQRPLRSSLLPVALAKRFRSD